MLYDEDIYRCRNEQTFIKHAKKVDWSSNANLWPSVYKIQTIVGTILAIGYNRDVGAAIKLVSNPTIAQ